MRATLLIIIFAYSCGPMAFYGFDENQLDADQREYTIECLKDESLDPKTCYYEGIIRTNRRKATTGNFEIQGRILNEDEEAEGVKIQPLTSSEKTALSIAYLKAHEMYQECVKVGNGRDACSGLAMTFTRKRQQHIAPLRYYKSQGGSYTGYKRCKRGKPCGHTCIASWKTCHK